MSRWQAPPSTNGSSIGCRGKEVAQVRNGYTGNAGFRAMDQSPVLPWFGRYLWQRVGSLNCANLVIHGLIYRSGHFIDPAISEESPREGGFGQPELINGGREIIELIQIRRLLQVTIRVEAVA